MPGKDKPNRFLLLYGTQTGQAEAISAEIAEKCQAYGLISDMHNLGQTEKKFSIERETCIVFVTSTTGDGDPPDEAQKFFRRLKKKTLPEDHLAHVNYALLGLGDSNYTNFCNAGKTLDRRLEQLGAKRFYPSGWGDDATGLEVAVEPWLEGLFPALCKCLGLPEVSVPDTNISSSTQTNGTVSEVNSELSSLNINDNNKSGGNSVNKSETSNNNTENNYVNTAESQIPQGQQTDKSNQSNNDDNVTNDEEVEETLRVSVPPLCEESLSVPVVPAAYLTVEFNQDQSLDLSSVPLQNGAKFASAAAEVASADITSCTVMTHEDAIKKTLCLRMKIQEDDMFNYLPGDAISVVCQNSESEVDRLLDRLCIKDKADFTCTLDILSTTKKRNPSVPSHYPVTCTLRHLFLTCVDIREVPKKALLRVFVEYTSDEKEKRRLQELCSKQGSSSYTRFIRESYLSVLDILYAFPSCQPPVERLLEHLPRLQPRPYSVCSSPLSEPGILEVVFNVVEIPEGEGRMFSRQGVATGMIDRLTSLSQQKYIDNLKEDSACSINSSLKVFPRTNQHFHMPDDLTIPIIMIGPGTGVAPFVGFLRHREALKNKMAAPETYGETWLFYGCRNRDKDFLYRRELERFEELGVLSKLCVCYSRESTDTPRYVQHNILNHTEDVVQLIDEKKAMIFVCGDAKHMAKDVNEAFISAIHKVKGCDIEEAKKQVLKMRLYKSYLEDVWT